MTATFDFPGHAARRRKLPYERLDQLVLELLMGRALVFRRSAPAAAFGVMAVDGSGNVRSFTITFPCKFAAPRAFFVSVPTHATRRQGTAEFPTGDGNTVALKTIGHDLQHVAVAGGAAGRVDRRDCSRPSQAGSDCASPSSGLQRARRHIAARLRVPQGAFS